MSTSARPFGGAVLLGRGNEASPDRPAGDRTGSVPHAVDVRNSLATVKGQAHFLLYLADQLEDALSQLDDGSEASHKAFLSKVLAMYSAQLETRQQGLGDRITEVCQELYLVVRDLESA